MLEGFTERVMLEGFTGRVVFEGFTGRVQTPVARRLVRDSLGLRLLKLFTIGAS